MTRSVLPFVLATKQEKAEPPLDHLDSGHAKRAALFWAGKHSGSQSKDVCFERITRAWRDPKRIAEVIASLTPEERAVLAVVRRFGGTISGSLLQRELLTRGVIKEATREERMYQRADADPVLCLCQRLVLVREPGYYDSYSYGLLREYPSVSLPRHVAVVVEPAASLEWKAAPRVAKAPESATHRAPAEVVVDLEQTTRALEALGRWKVNQGGALPAALRNRIGKVVPALGNDPLEAPDRVALHYALLCGLGVVEGDGASGGVKPGRAERLFQFPHEVQASMWIRAWMNLRIWQDGIGDVPDRDNRDESTRINPKSMREARELLVWALTRIAHGSHDWLDLEDFLLDLYAATGEHGLSFYWHRYAWQPGFHTAASKEKLPAGFERSRAFWMDDEGVWAANALLSTFVHLGLVERGRSGGARSERWSFRLTDVGRVVFGAPEVQVEKRAESEKCLTIQPNHEILLYLDAADGAAVMMLGRIATRASTTGIVQTFKLTRESVYRALEGGMTSAAIEAFLTARSRSGLPANVADSLSEWSRKRDALVVRSSVALGVNLPDGQAVMRGRGIGARFVVASARAATASAKALHIAAEAESRTWSVDEDGIVVTGDRLSLIGAARLRRFARPSSGGWRITSESIRAARDLGISADQVLAWLDEHLGHAIPPILASAIRNWAGGRGKVFLGEVVLLQVSDPGTFEALSRSKRLRPFVKGTLSPGCLLIAADLRKQAMKLLGELGFALDATCKLESEAATAPPPSPTPTKASRRSRGFVELEALRAAEAEESPL